MSARPAKLPEIDDWTAEEALAIYDFCVRMSEVLWVSHADVLLEQMLGRPDHGGFSASPSDWRAVGGESNLELPFEDDEPF